MGECDELLAILTAIAIKVKGRITREKRKPDAKEDEPEDKSDA